MTKAEEARALVVEMREWFRQHYGEAALGGRVDALLALAAAGASVEGATEAWCAPEDVARVSAFFVYRGHDEAERARLGVTTRVLILAGADR
jgi:hypothetical protein